MADARSANGSFFSSFSTNSGGSSLAVAAGDDVFDDKAEVVAVVDDRSVVVAGKIVNEFCSTSSDGSLQSSAADDVDAFAAVIVDDDAIVVFIDVEADQDEGVEECCSNTNSDNDDLLEVDEPGPVDIDVEDWIVAVDAQPGETEVVAGEKVALDKGRMSKSSGRKKHHEFHFSLDATPNDNPEAGAVVDGDVRDSGDEDSGWVGVDSVDSDDGVSGGDPDGEGDDEEDSDIGDWLVFFLIVTTNMCLKRIHQWLSWFWFKTDNNNTKYGVHFFDLNSQLLPGGQT